MPEPNAASTQARIDPKFMFSNHKDVPKAGIEKRQRKLLQKIPFIGAFLQPDEKILLVTTCVSPTSIFEQLTMGWIFAFINRALLVVTNKGVFHIPTTINFNYRHSIAKIRYDDCTRVEIRGRTLLVQYANGKKERFLYLPRAQRLKLKVYFKSLSLRADAKTNVGKMQLCPRCTKTLAAGIYQCGACRLPFKDMATAMKVSLLLPGGGYFYTGHYFLGLGDFLVELMLLIFVIVGIGEMIEGQSEAVATVIFFGFFLILEKLLTVHHARRFISEYIPKEKTVQLKPLTA